MKARAGKRICSALLSVMLCFIIFQPQPVRAADIYFTSINDNLLPLTADSMPLWSNGLLYVPYNVFDRNATGLNIDVNSSYSRTENAVRIYNLKGMLTFNITTGECWDEFSGKEYYGRAILRNGKPYVSVRTVCEMFGLTYSYLTIDQGYLVRIKSDSVILSDARFVDAAQNLINRRLQEYKQSIAPPPPPVTPEVEKPQPQPQPDVEPEQTVHPKVDTYLAFACENTAGMKKILNALQGENNLAVFFMTPELLNQEGDLVRRLLGEGHSVGVWAKGENKEQVLEQVWQGNAALEEHAFARTTLVLAADGVHSALKNSGLICWNDTLTLKPTDTVGPNYYAGVVSQRLNGRTRTTYLTFEGGENTARVLAAVLRQLEAEEYVVRIPLETRI